MSFPLNLPFLGDVRLLLFISSPHLVPLLSPCWDLVDDLMTWPCAKSLFDEWGWILNQLCLQTIRIYRLGPLFYSGSSSSRQIHSITSSPRFPTMDWAFPILNGPNHNHSQSWNVPSFWDIWWYNIIYVLYILCTYVYIYTVYICVYYTYSSLFIVLNPIPMKIGDVESSHPIIVSTVSSIFTSKNGFPVGFNPEWWLIPWYTHGILESKILPDEKFINQQQGFWTLRWLRFRVFFRPCRIPLAALRLFEFRWNALHPLGFTWRSGRSRGDLGWLGETRWSH